jgi:hypothetical protein
VNLLNIIPCWILGPVVVFGAAASCAALQYLLRRSQSLEVLARNNEVAGFKYSVVGVIYGVVAGLVLFQAFAGYSQSKDALDNEADAFADLWRDAIAFPEPMRDAIHEDLDVYFDVVVSEEWKAMRSGHSSDKAGRALNQLYATYARYRPDGSVSPVWEAASLAQLTRIGDARRVRLLKCASSIPRELWVALVLGGLVNFGFPFFFGTKSLAAQLAMTASIAGLIALLLFTVLILDNPFSGSEALTPDALIAVRQRTMNGF